MRADWDRRAREDANFYVAFGRQQQQEDEFASTAAIITPAILVELNRLPEDMRQGRVLDIGCGPGRLMLALSQQFSEIHGIDISKEMIDLAKTRLADTANAHLHVGSGADLQPLQDGSFDLVYSYVVFQHIPSKEVVLNYMRESKRVLKPGGILCCQLRGQDPLPSELRPEAATWTGCTFKTEEILEFARKEEFPLVGLAGVDTQYVWATFRKPARSDVKRDPMSVRLNAVTQSNGSEPVIPNRGREAVASLWMDAFPSDGDLSNFQVMFNDRRQFGMYVSPVGLTGGCQMNVQLPPGLKPGSVTVRLAYRETPIGPGVPIEVVEARPLNPRVLEVTDGINLTTRNRAETGGLKVLIEEVPDPKQVSFAVDGAKVKGILFESRDPIMQTYEFTIPIPSGVHAGSRNLEVTMGEASLALVPIEIA